jgi:hypothetical protein
MLGAAAAAAAANVPVAVEGKLGVAPREAAHSLQRGARARGGALPVKGSGNLLPSRVSRRAFESLAGAAWWFLRSRASDASTGSTVPVTVVVVVPVSVRTMPAALARGARGLEVPGGWGGGGGANHRTREKNLTTGALRVRGTSDLFKVHPRKKQQKTSEIRSDSTLRICALHMRISHFIGHRFHR